MNNSTRRERNGTRALNEHNKRREAVRIGILCALVWAGWISVSTASADTWHVATNGSDEAGVAGTNWATALCSISNALQHVAANDTVLVYDGTYTLSASIAISGETKKGVTVKSVNGREATIIDGNNAVLCIDIYTNAVLDGFTITRGRRGAQLKSNVMDVDGIMIRNCTFVSNNAASGAGGGIFFSSGVGTVSNCLVMYNYAPGYGGGISLKVPGSRVLNSTIMYNSATNTTQYGGGIVCYEGTVVENCLIISNQAWASGGIRVAGADAVVRNSLIAGNTGWFTNAAAGAGGVDIASAGVGALVQNCTIVSNVGNKGGGVGMAADASVVNSIVYYNRGRTVPDNSNVYVTAGSFINCCVAPDQNVNGSGNITLAPEFISEANGNFRLQRQSPCINAGINQEEWMDSAKDLDGHNRIDVFMRQVDIGAYEYVLQGGMFRLR